MRILAFGIAREILKGSESTLNVPDPSTAGEILVILKKEHPGLNALASLALAVNGTYAQATLRIHPSDEIALIPPVSGG